MRDQVGKMIGLGIAEGITDSRSQVEAAMAKLNKNLIAEGSINFAATSGYENTQIRSVPKQEVHLHIGTLIADDYGLKQLERKLMSIRIGETARLGGEPA